MNKVIESLSKLLPEKDVKEVASAVEEMLGDAKKGIETEFNTKLEEAYAQLAKEMKDQEQIALTGYQEAYTIIQDLRNRLDTQRSEFDTALEEGYEEAYQMLLAERGKRENLETELYAEYDKKLADMKNYMVDKIDQFLQLKGKEIYEQTKREIANDPRMVEHKVALDKIVETVSGYISNEDYAVATNAKIDSMKKALDEAQGQVRILEARNIRLGTENNKLNESVRHNQEVLKEQTVVADEKEKKERTQKAQNVQGRGKQVTETVEVIGEAKTEPETKETEETTKEMSEWVALSGIPAKK